MEIIAYIGALWLMVGQVLTYMRLPAIRNEAKKARRVEDQRIFFQTEVLSSMLLSIAYRLPKIANR